MRLQYDGDLPPDILATLLDELELSPEDLYEGEGFTAFSDLFQLYAAVDVPRLKDRPLPPHPVPAFEHAPDIWSAIRARDVLVHHPYHAFDAVTRFVREAAVDPKVLAIKMTLYRVSPASPIAHALRTAVENGKEVAVLVELQARFDEEANIRWARALEEVGAHVVYGLAGFKTHCKACLVVRQESGRHPALLPPRHRQLQRPHGRRLRATSGSSRAASRSARTSPQLFNLLTGYTRPHGFHHLLLAPERPARRAHRAHPPRGRPRPGRAAGADHREDERARGPAPDRGAVRGQRGGREHRPDRARHLLPAPRGARALGEHPRHLDRRPLPRARPRSSTSRTRASRNTCWPPPTGCPATSTAASRSRSRCWIPDLQAQVREILEIQLADTVKARRILSDGGSVRAGAGGAPALRSQERLYDALAATT